MLGDFGGEKKSVDKGGGRHVALIRLGRASCLCSHIKSSVAAPERPGVIIMSIQLREAASLDLDHDSSDQRTEPTVHVKYRVLCFQSHCFIVS